MFNSLKRLFSGSDDTGEDAVEPHEAAAALLVEAALADGIYADMESDMIAMILLESFDFDAGQADELLRRGEFLAEGAIGAHQFTKRVKSLPITERVAVIEGLYRVALADGDRCPYEDAYIRHVSSLLHVDDVARAGARREAEARVAMDKKN
ncbi:MAG: TerB family tellurite resistance protein [Alphaproteobacteria bacterium]|nr:TerB family tellurite resistance protein [Alphaproteobacteria bacterium]